MIMSFLVIQDGRPAATEGLGVEGFAAAAVGILEERDGVALRTLSALLSHQGTLVVGKVRGRRRRRPHHRHIHGHRRERELHPL